MNINKNNYEAYFLDYHEGNLSPQEVADLFLFLSQHPELKKDFENFENILLEDFSLPVFGDKENLKKNITTNNCDDYFIRFIEGTLTANEIQLLEVFLKLNPASLKSFNLFKKTKLQTDTSIVFKNKLVLKRPIAVTEEQLIAFVEGVASPEEGEFITQQLAVDPVLQKMHTAFEHTKLLPDTRVMYPQKQSLKRKERKVIPLFYSAAVAASVILLFGLFFLTRLNTNAPVDHQFTDNKKQPVIEKETAKNAAIVIPQKERVPQSTDIAMLKNKKNPDTVPEKFLKKNVAVDKKDSVVMTTPIAVDPSAIEITSDNSIASQNTTNEIKNTLSPIDSLLPKVQKNHPSIAGIEKKAPAKEQQYASLGDFLTNKLREKLFDVQDSESEKKEKNPKKISGWDIAGIFAKGLSNLTGKKIEVKPQFNEEGTVTAYALSAGKFEFSRIK